MTDGPEQDVDLEDDSGAVIAAVGRQVRLWREAAKMRAADLGAAIGYGENQVYKVEAGKRIPRPEFLDRADEVLGAGGKLAAMKKDVAEARYPKKVRDLAKLEADAVELGAYENGVVHGLLQTEEYARALYGERRPAFSGDQVERLVAARMARQSVFERQPAPLPGLCPGRGDAQAPDRGQNGVAPPTRTPSAAGLVEACRDPGHAHGDGGARGAGGLSPSA